MVFLIRHAKRRRQLTRRHYHVLVAGSWLYATAWLLAGYLVWLSSYWSLGYKVLAELALVIVTPDIKSLFMSYPKYLDEQHVEIRN